MQNSRTSKAFTLVELLVVVAIIALLISILLPALGKAQQIAREVVCRSNLHQVGISISMYTAEFRGDYPQHFVQFINQDQRLMAPLHTRYARFGGTSAAFDPKVRRTPVSLGLLVQQVMTDTAKIFYCPAQTVEKHMFDLYDQDPWTGGVQGNTDSFTGLIYNPSVRLDSGKWVLQKTNAAHRTDLPSVLAMDLLPSSVDAMSHGPAWNVLHDDMSAIIYKSETAMDIVASKPKWAQSGAMVQFNTALDHLLGR